MAALTPVQIAAAAYIGGFHGDDVAKAVQLALTVSGGDPGKVGSGDHYGLFQIKKGSHNNLLNTGKWNNPADNARMANVIWQKRASLLHSSGQWSKSDWSAIGSTAYNANAAAGKAAWSTLKDRMENGASPEKVLGSSRSDGSKTPEGGIGSGPANDVAGADDPSANSTGDSIKSLGNAALGTLYKMGISSAVLVGAALLFVLGVIILLRQPLMNAKSAAIKAAVG